MDQITRAAHFALSTVLRDEPWQDLGFSARPRYGGIVQKFRPLWKVQLEKTALKHMLALFAAAHVHADVVGVPDLPGVVDILVDGPNGSSELWRSYGYTSRAEAKDGLTRTIDAYVSALPEGWSSILASALDTAAVPDRRLGAQLFVGTSRLAQTAEDMLPYLQADAG
jgi:hypothetical protein